MTVQSGAATIAVFVARRAWRRTGVGLLVATCALWGCGLCASAYAKSPTGDFVPFSQCPRFVSTVSLCLFARVTGGQIKVANLAVPVVKPIVLQAGIIVEGEGETLKETVVPPIDGEALSKAPQAVPGGLLGLVSAGSLPRQLQKPFEETVARGLAGVTATTELVGVPLINGDNLINEEGTGLSLPVRIKLDNAFLGENCYVGSRMSPVVLNLTTGKTTPPPPNKPIAGKVGQLKFEDEFDLLTLSGMALVDNEFSVPGMAGCGGSLAGLLDPLMDAKLGLPSVAGRNTTILTATVEEATTKDVIASER